jgi:osmotically-inducible protein OsmY
MGEQRRPRWSWLLAGFLLLGGCNRQDADRLAKVSRKGLARAQCLLGAVTDGLPTGFQGGLELVNDAGLDHRVTARLRWDKTLEGTSIEVRTQGNVVELRGKVHDLPQRRRAVEIAETTMGVDKVTDALQIENP